MIENETHNKKVNDKYKINFMKKEEGKTQGKDAKGEISDRERYVDTIKK